MKVLCHIKDIRLELSQPNPELIPALLEGKEIKGDAL